MTPTSALLSDMGSRSPFVCRSCLVSLRAAQNRPAWPPWTATSATSMTATATTTIAVRTITRQAAFAQRTRKAPSRPAARQNTPPSRRTAAPAPSPKPAQLPEEQLTLPSMEELLKASEFDPKNPFGRDSDVVVRYFNQEDDGSIRQTRSSGLTSEEEQQLEMLQGQLKETQRMINKYEARGANGAARRRMVRSNPKYETIKELEKEAQEEALEVGEQDRNEGDSTASLRIDDTGLTATARRHVKNLNNILRPAARRLQPRKAGAGVDTKIITALWSRYGAARTGLAESWSNIPPAVWDCLWKVLAWDDAQGGVSNVRNPRRMSHVYYLAKDMQAAGVVLTDAQQLLAMEAMFIEGWPAAALENWRRGAATLGVRPGTAVDYWELGVRMCALQGDLERAERAADRLFSSELEEHLKKVATPKDKTRGDPRVLFQLIRSAASQDAKDKAWAMYRKLRDLLGEETDKKALPDTKGSHGPSGMTIDDYDTVVACFLTANHTEYAFDVFVDMMFSGALDVHQQKVQKQGTTGRTRLPSSVANHFFFGKWLKRLIGAGDLDGAYRVLQFMQARGIMTASVQVNGLLGAWLRSGTAENQARADTLAWRMVESRRLFVDLRRRERAMDWPLQLRVGGMTAGEVATAAMSGSSENSQNEDLTFVPKATVETFLLMADNYKNRGQLAQLEKLWEAFRACEMPSTDAFMMNQLLESYVHDGRADEARALYRDLVLGPSKIVPNAHTFLVLFKSLAVHRQVFRAMSDDERRASWIDCRQLVAEMVKLANVAFQPETTGPLDTREVVFFQALGRMMLHTFRKTGDYVGLCVMLQTLRPLLSVGSPGGQPRFGMTDSLAIELVAESSELQRDSPAARHRILRSSEAVEALLREVRLRRLKVHGWHAGDGTESVDGVDRRGGALNLSDDLAAVVAHVYRIKCEGVSDVAFAAMYEDAVDELGVRAYL
ncbi:hypothetical protein SBRCBS47491_000583 [Sporothrix bragantina]|uniref:Pentatricopeptide repeat protein n=1 Tax=Sporothrix bragantina TaxID=671064 RepID=A0ABP0ARJ2_9PEZI